MDVRAIDVFCGAGGLTHGLRQAKINVRAGIDIEPACQYPIEFNTQNETEFILEDVQKLEASKVKRWLSGGDFTCIAGCAPCQPFSNYTQKKGRSLDQRWRLVTSFCDLLEDVRPDVFTMENVPNLARTQVFEQFMMRMADANYHLLSKVVRCTDRGIPQNRSRLIVLGSRIGEISLSTSKRCKPKTVRDAIAHLDPIEAGGIASRDRLHAAAGLTPLNLARIQASSPGGSWRDWPSHLVSTCHNAKTGANFPSVYGRMAWDAPAPTITTQFFNYGSGRFGHPEQDRAISLREAALLQSFPRGYRFLPNETPLNFRGLGRLIGNAVPPAIGKLIGKSLMKHLAQKA